MLKTRFNRYTTTLLTFTLASIFLYPVAQAGWVTPTWIFLCLAVLAAIITLTTK